MAEINMDSILSKAKKRMQDSDMQKRVEKIIDKMFLSFSASPGSPPLPSDVAKKFIEVLQAEIKSHSGMEVADGGLGETAIDALTGLTYGAPIKAGRNRYKIPVSFSGNLQRKSLYQKKYPDGIENIAALLNTGYDFDKRVYGMWHGEKIASLPQRDGAHFIESAIRTFMANYATQYGVIDIEVDDIYK